MNPIISASKAQTMTSKQIAVVVEKRHDNVKRTIENLANQGVISFTQIEETSHQGAGARPVAVYVVSERNSYIIVAQLCPEYTAKLVDYWMATKSQAPTIPQTLPEALRLAADLAEQKAKVEQQLAIAAPKAEALDRIADTTGVFGIREAAKALKIKQDMDDFDISIASVARRAGYNENRIRQILKGLNTSTFVIDVVRQTVDQLIAKSIKKRHSKNPVEYAPFDDGTDDRDLFCAGIPKNLALLSVGVQP